MVGGLPGRGTEPSIAYSPLHGLCDDAFDLAAVDLEFPGYGSLTAASGVPCQDRLLQG